MSSRALPMILPVRFALDRDRIVISTHDGSTLHKATRDAVVAFEADGLLADSHRAWSVHVNGIASHVGDPADADQLVTLRLPSWSTSQPPRFVSVSTDHIDGRLMIDERPPTADCVPHRCVEMEPTET